MANALPIFVSHSHEDSAFCQALVTALRGAGADVWFDEHNLGAGHLMDVIQQELGRRKIFIVILSKHAFASKWVRRETGWAYSLYDRDPTRVILPVTASAIERDDFSPENSWLFLEDFKRIEALGFQSYPLAEAVGRVLHALALTPAGEAPAPMAPQPTESVGDLITRGKALQQQGKHVEALTLFERATQLDPNSDDAWFNVGYSLDALGRYEQALAACDRALSLNRSDAVVWNNKGKALLDLQRYGEALAAYEQSLALDPKYVLAWNGKGNALLGLQRYDEALVAYEQVLSLDLKYTFAWNGKGNALQDGLGRSQEALTAFEQALALDPRMKEAWLGKGNALYSLKRHEEEIAAYRQAVAIDPTIVKAWSYMASTLRSLGRTQEAEEAEARAKALGG